MALRISQWISSSLWMVVVFGLTGFSLSACQTLVGGVDAILQHDDAPQFNVQQEQAFLAFEQGRYQEAVPLFESAIKMEINPGLKAKLYNGLGSSLNELNQRDAAVKAYQESLKITDNAQVWVNLGIAQRLNGAYDDALKSYEQALALDDSLATAHSSIGSLRVLQGKPQLAIAAFQNAIKLDANMAVSHGNLALAYAMVGDFKAAQTSLKRAIALGYDNGDVIQKRIQELQKLKQNRS